MNRLIYIYVLLIMTFLGSCVPESLEVQNVPKAESKLVVSTIMVPDQTLLLALTQSFGALDAGNDSDPATLLEQVVVADAIVTVEFDNVVIPLTQTANGFYTSTEIFQNSDAVYKLQVHDLANDRHIEAETELKQSIIFDSVKVEMELSSIDTFPKVSFQFQDPPGENWYMINVHKFLQAQELYDSFIENQPYTYLLTDADFEDGEIIKDDFIAIHNEDYDEGDTLIVSLSNISQEYYNYLKTRDDERLSIDFLSEPFNLPTNVINGYGFFNLHIQDPRMIVLN